MQSNQDSESFLDLRSTHRQRRSVIRWNRQRRFQQTLIRQGLSEVSAFFAIDGNIAQSKCAQPIGHEGPTEIQGDPGRDNHE